MTLGQDPLGEGPIPPAFGYSGDPSSLNSGYNLDGFATPCPIISDMMGGDTLLFFHQSGGTTNPAYSGTDADGTAVFAFTTAELGYWVDIASVDNSMNASSWGLTFLKSFLTFDGGPGNVPTCTVTALRHIFEDFFPSPSAASVLQAAAPGVQAVAINTSIVQTQAGIDAYVAARGLTVPLRSSVVRAMVTQGAERAVAVGARVNLAVQTIAVDAAAIHSMYTTSGEARNGQCAAAFPIF